LLQLQKRDDLELRGQPFDFKLDEVDDVTPADEEVGLEVVVLVVRFAPRDA
jgi:hypothetical protein